MPVRVSMGRTMRVERSSFDHGKGCGRRSEKSDCKHCCERVSLSLNKTKSALRDLWEWF